MTNLRQFAERRRAGQRAASGPLAAGPPQALLATAALLGIHLPQLPPPPSAALLQRGPVNLGLAQGQVQIALGLGEEAKAFTDALAGTAAGSGEATALDRVFPVIDSRWKDGLNLKQWKKGECTSLARLLSLVGVSKSAPAKDIKRRNVHTGMILRGHSGIGALQGDLLTRKLRLAVMSFLATQDLSRTRLRIWADVDSNATFDTLKSTLGRILRRKELARSVQLRHFNATHEFPKVSTDSGQLLLDLYNSVPSQQLAVKSDLERACILYNYGGLWLDSDVLLIQDVSPLMDRDWAYFGEVNLINNAVLSVSTPRSLFASSYLLTLVQQNVAPDGTADVGPRAYFRYGPKILDLLYSEEWTRRTFHILPPCFFDGTWSREHGVGEAKHPWDDFFSRSLAKSPEMQQELAFLYPLNEGHEFFGYHWHGRWTKPISNQSLAWALERIYWSKLNLSGTP